MLRGRLLLRGVVLADTDPLYALRDPDDASHGRAREDLENLRAQRFGVVASYSTLTGGHALVLRKLGLAEARSFLRYLIKTAVFVTPTAEATTRSPPGPSTTRTRT